MSKATQIAVATNAGAYSALAIALNMAMFMDSAAQARYLAIYGVSWSDVPAIGGEVSNTQVKSHALTTTVGTVR